MTSSEVSLFAGGTDAGDDLEAVKAAFGMENRTRLLDGYFRDSAAVAAGNAWEHVYRLLLWIDRTTGLAHCYESDKCQPGKPWYLRSLAFHDWASAALGLEPSELADSIDLLFKSVTSALAITVARDRQTAAASQRVDYEDRGFPEAGTDPELESIVRRGIAPLTISDERLRALTERILAHINLENKRKNLVGEGFEDTLAAILERLPKIQDHYRVMVRPVLHDIPGFHEQRGADKAKKVDLALVNRLTGHRSLVSCKWSVRSDREEQFRTDFREYTSLEALGESFSYVLVTNEFDPARLARACEMRSENSRMFTDVVHVNLSGPRAVYDAPVGRTRRRAEGGQERSLGYMRSGRLTSLSDWFRSLA